APRPRAPRPPLGGGGGGGGMQQGSRVQAHPLPTPPPQAGGSAPSVWQGSTERAARAHRDRGDVGWAKAPTGWREAPPRRRAHAHEKTIMLLRVACPRRSAIIRVGNGGAAVAHPTRAQHHRIHASSPLRPVGGVAGAGGGGAHVHV